MLNSKGQEENDLSLQGPLFLLNRFLVFGNCSISARVGASRSSDYCVARRCSGTACGALPQLSCGWKQQHGKPTTMILFCSLVFQTQGGFAWVCANRSFTGESVKTLQPKGLTLVGFWLLGNLPQVLLKTALENFEPPIFCLLFWVIFGWGDQLKEMFSA